MKLPIDSRGNFSTYPDMGLPHHDPDLETMSDGSDGCASSAIIGSPLWPQSFGRTMDIYSRSTSQRSDVDSGLEGIHNAFEEESREPLLAKLECSQSEHIKGGVLGTEDSGRLASENSEQGSSFFQALFNGMNVLAGTVTSATPSLV